MKEPKEHLDIDLEFLDKKEPVRVAPKKPEPPKGKEPNWRFYDPNNINSNSGEQYNWKNILIIGGVILFFGWVIFSDNNSSSTPSTSNNSYMPSTQTSNQGGNNDTVVRGQYRCSSYNASQSDTLAPSESEATISNEQSSFEQRSTYLDNLKREIDNSYVNEYSSQYEINDYNQKVDEYNTKLTSYKRDVTSLDSRIDRFNTQINAYNNYLITHCTKAY